MRCDDKVVKLDTLVTSSIPDDNEFITDIISDDSIKDVKSIRVNMVVEMSLSNGEMAAIKFPDYTPLKVVERYIFPLVKMINKRNK